ncbi:MAG: NUDIX hydrolase [Verrucomicrobiae bacterium]|nr:NUDIX hydrolase [Verrucomicrobiae bacterium]
MSETDETVHEGRFLSYRRTSRGWEYVSRTNAKGCVAILAETEDRRILLVEQMRPPVGRRVIELPAGLAGDIPLQEDEPLLVAARRELKEETGYEAKHWIPLLEGTSSAGMTDELVTIYYATGLVRMTEGGGVHGEDIRLHHVHRDDVLQWCRDRESEGMRVDFKIFAALFLARAIGGTTGSRLWY